MAYDGELVKMQNGKWARFQRCHIVNAGHQEMEETTLLVAVELEERYQALLERAGSSLTELQDRGIPVSLELEDSGEGTLRLRLGEAGAEQPALQ
jgi:hypothetical protein